MLTNLQGSPEPHATLPPPSQPAPRVMVRQTEGGQAIEPVYGAPVDLDAFLSSFLAAFGSADAVVAEALFGQLLNGLHTEPGKPVDCATANLALALMHEIGPKDVAEAMLATEMIVAHMAAMDTIRLGLHTEQTPGGRQTYLGLSRKLMSL